MENEYIQYEQEETNSLIENLESLEKKWFKTASQMKKIKVLKHYIELKKVLVADLIKFVDDSDGEK